MGSVETASGADHPHGRGEKRECDGAGAGDPGSSPRAWGKGQPCGNALPCLRIIPTGVGKRECGATTIPAVSDHPHGRGEKAHPPRTRPMGGGSSPRAWGKGRVLAHAVHAPRIIPTGVGKSKFRPDVVNQIPDHPHGRGEKPRVGLLGRERGGSSPRAWGKATDLTKRTPSARIIPTGVGKSPRPSPFPPSLAGSSPRAWGKGILLICTCCLLRIIPTGVGKRALPHGVPRRKPDHPHGRGEKLFRLFGGEWGDGSSPRAWGKGGETSCEGCAQRIIPTGVGKRPRYAPSARPVPDHPHGRGEKLTSCQGPPAKSGSSPRAWGKAHQERRRCSSDRIIPTGVGKRAAQREAVERDADHPHGRGEKPRPRSVHQPAGGSSPRAWGKAIR